MNLKNKNILVIDDTHSILTFLRISLEAAGASFYGAVTAAGGIALCETANPDLVILDLKLPDNEGLNILPKLKRTNKDKNLPIIILTAHKEQEILDKAMQMGADLCITKPFIVEDLIRVIHDQLHMDKEARLVSAS